MGLREKADYNLQTVSLVSALLTILFVCAARHYTSNWRQRRIFRRHLADTQRRLTSEPNNKDNRDNRRRWKRFVAAAPLMPLATAYVAVRLGWDVFELLVFCFIDAARNTSTSLYVSGRLLAIRIHIYVSDTMTRLDFVRRAQVAAIYAVETAVTWLFESAFPLVFYFCEQVVHGARHAAGWWDRVGGAVRLRDAIETAVLEGLVPAVHAVHAAACRVAWLGRRIAQAVGILAVDLLRDIRIAAAGTRVLFAWLTSTYQNLYQRWHPAVLRLSAALLELFRRPQWAQHILYILSVASTCWDSYISPLLSRFSVAAYAGTLHAATTLRALVLWLRSIDLSILHWLALRCVIQLRRLVLATVLASRSACRVVGPAAIAFLTATRILGTDVYLAVSQRVFIPTASVLLNVLGYCWRQLGSLVRAAESWLLRVGAWIATRCAAALLPLVDATWMWLETASAASARWLAAMTDQAVRALMQAVAAATRSADWLAMIAGRAGRAAVDSLWPAMCCGGRDAVQAMTDVCHQLAALADVAVAMIGDLIVEYARQNTVHTHADSVVVEDCPPTI